MHAVWLKIKADILGRPLLSMLIVISMATSAALLTLALATLLNLSAPYDRSFRELHGAHLWLYFDRAKTRRRDVERIEALPGVVESTGLRYGVTCRVRFGDTRLLVSLQAMPTDMPTVNRLMVMEGRYLEPHREEVVAGRELRELHHLSVGEAVEITRQDGRKVVLPVVGLAYNPMWDTYRNTRPPYLYVTQETLRRLFPDERVWEWSLGLRLADPEAVDKVLAQVKEVLHTDALVGHTDWHDVRESAVFGAQINLVFLGAFSFFAILATVLVITTNISSTVLAQFRQIGMLKAIGFTRGQIMALYLGRYWLLNMIGAPLGLLVGVALAPLPLRSVAAALSTDFRPPLRVDLVAGVLTATTTVVLAAAWRAAGRGAKANIVQAIAVGAEPPRGSVSRWSELAGRLGVPMVLILGLNDLLARPLRSFMTGLNLMLGVIGIVFGLSLNKTLAAYEKDPSLLGIVYDASVTRVETADSKVRGLLRRAPGVEAFYGEQLVEAETTQGRSFQMRAVEGELEAFPFRIEEGRFFDPDTYEAIAGRGLLDWLGLKVGDELTVTLKGSERYITWHIVGEYPEPVNAGQMLMVGLPAVRRVLHDVEPRTYYLKLSPDANPAQIRRYLEPRPDSDLSIVFVGQNIPDVVVYLEMAILALSVVLVCIALINVFNTSWLAVQERVRVVGVLKTLGMTPAQVVVMVNAMAAFLGLAASGVGIPGGLIFTRLLLSTMSRMYGFGRVQTSVNPIYVLLLVPVMIMVSMVGSAFPARQAARLSIVSVLRNE